MCCIFKEFSNVWKCFSNPDLRRSELSLDAMLQRTSSNSSSSSSPSSQGGSAERRGNENRPGYTYTQSNTQTRTPACKHSETGACTRSCTHANVDTENTETSTFREFQRLSAGHCQSQFCSDQPVGCALLLSASGDIEERKWERLIERGVRGCVKQQARGISKICMDLPMTNTWQRDRLKYDTTGFPSCLLDVVTWVEM